MKKTLVVLYPVFTAILLQACAILTRWEFSKPSIAPGVPGKLLGKDHLALPGPEIGIMAQNLGANLAFLGPGQVAVPFFPIPRKPRSPIQTPFSGKK